LGIACYGGLPADIVECCELISWIFDRLVDFMLEYRAKELTRFLSSLSAPSTAETGSSTSSSGGISNASSATDDALNPLMSNA
jgi:hypothetical protein